MVSPRRIREVLEIVLKNLEDNKFKFNSGLCSFVGDLNDENIISAQEYFYIRIYIQKNRPNIYSSLSAFLHRNHSFYWKRGVKKYRIKWLKKHIQKLKNNEDK